MKIVFATGNKNKLKEMRAFVPKGFELVGLDAVGITEEIPEDHETLVENAFQKAQYVYDRTGQLCFADDTGLEIDALNGAPGVYSARYAGPQKSAEDNMNRVLTELEGVEGRQARFRTIIALVGEGVRESFEGEVVGQILTEKRGNDGFGYDPIFKPEGEERSFAEMPLEAKNTMSHRTRALQKLLDHLEDSER